MMRHRIIFSILMVLLTTACNEARKDGVLPFVPLRGPIPEVENRIDANQPSLNVNAEPEGEDNRDSSPPPSTVSTVFIPLSIVTASLDDGLYGVAYHETLSTSGGSGHCQWTVRNIPTGLSLTGADECMARIEGTPTGMGNFTANVSVCDTEEGTCDERLLEFTIGDEPVIRVYHAGIGNDGRYHSFRRLDLEEISSLELVKGEETLVLVAENRGGKEFHEWSVNQDVLRLEENVSVAGESRPGVALIPFGEVEGDLLLSIADRPLTGVVVRAEDTESRSAEVQFESITFISGPCAARPSIELVSSSVPDLSLRTVTRMLGSSVSARFRAVGGQGPYEWTLTSHVQHTYGLPDCSELDYGASLCLLPDAVNNTWETHENADGTFDVTGRFAYEGVISDSPQEVLTVEVTDSCPRSAIPKRYLINLTRPPETIADLKVAMSVIEIGDADSANSNGLGSFLRVSLYRQDHQKIAWVEYDVAECRDSPGYSACTNAKGVSYDMSCNPGECAWEIPVTEINEVELHFADRMDPCDLGDEDRLDFNLLSMSFSTDYLYALFDDEQYNPRGLTNYINDNVVSKDCWSSTGTIGRMNGSDTYDITDRMTGYPAHLWLINRHQGM